MIKQKRVNSFNKASFKCRVSEEKLKQLVESFTSFRQILHTSEVDIFENSGLFSSKIWEKESYVEEGNNSFSLALEIKTQKLTIEKLYRESIIAEISEVGWPRLIELNLLSCRITSIESLALLNANWLTILNLAGNYITKIRGVVKLSSAKKLSLLVIDNKTLSSQALSEISQANLLNLRKIMVHQLEQFERYHSYEDYCRQQYYQKKYGENRNWPSLYSMETRTVNYNFLLKLNCPEIKNGLNRKLPKELTMLLENVEDCYEPWMDGCMHCTNPNKWNCFCIADFQERMYPFSVENQERSKYLHKGFFY